MGLGVALCEAGWGGMGIWVGYIKAYGWCENWMVI